MASPTYSKTRVMMVSGPLPVSRLQVRDKFPVYWLEKDVTPSLSPWSYSKIFSCFWMRPNTMRPQVRKYRSISSRDVRACVD